MNYKQKYLKYKLKYLKLIGGYSFQKTKHLQTKTLKGGNTIAWLFGLLTKQDIDVINEELSNKIEINREHINNYLSSIHTNIEKNIQQIKDLINQLKNECHQAPPVAHPLPPPVAHPLPPVETTNSPAASPPPQPPA